jgi:2'-5' RNA ligase
MTLRLFTGIAAPPDINSRIDDFVRPLKPLVPIRWSPASNFHITTKFIGSWPEDRLTEMKSTLATLPPTGPFKIAIRGLGFYPNPQRPRIFWTGVDGGEPLVQLAAQTDALCATLGIPSETKPYSPHLTLARMDPKARLAPLHTTLAKLPAPDFGDFDVTAFHLYLSQQLTRSGHGGSVYTSLAEFPL